MKLIKGLAQALYGRGEILADVLVSVTMKITRTQILAWLATDSQLWMTSAAYHQAADVVLSLFIREKRAQNFAILPMAYFFRGVDLHPFGCHDQPNIFV